MGRVHRWQPTGKTPCGLAVEGCQHNARFIFAQMLLNAAIGDNETLIVEEMRIGGGRRILTYDVGVTCQTCKNNPSRILAPPRIEETGLI